LKRAGSWLGRRRGRVQAGQGLPEDGARILLDRFGIGSARQIEFAEILLGHAPEVESIGVLWL
jgi:hypothetical protein